MSGADWGYALPFVFALLAVIFGGWAVALLLTPERSAPRPPTATRRGPYCQAAHCHLPAYWLDLHKDGHHLWTCPGHHHEGHRYGWLVDRSAR